MTPKSKQKAFLAGLRAALSIAEEQARAPSWWIRDQLRALVKREEEKGKRRT